MLVQIHEFQKTQIRTAEINGAIWFSGQDVFSVLGLTWKGVYDLQRRGVSKERICKRSTQSLGGMQETVFIDEIALYKIVLRANKSEIADKFTDWVAELLVKVRKAIDEGRSDDLRKHLYNDIQRSYSKQVNAKNYTEGGVEQIKEYNRKNCQLHTGLTPTEIKTFGKSKGLKSKETSSAKEVLRHIAPEIACGMSFTDKLVTENGIDHLAAAETSVKLAQPLFARLMQLGVSRTELE